MSEVSHEFTFKNDIAPNAFKSLIIVVSSGFVFLFSTRLIVLSLTLAWNDNSACVQLSAFRASLIRSDKSLVVSEIVLISLLLKQSA